MGIIKKVLFRGDLLGPPKHHTFFLDMEENIHIHYRDLRIELSRDEFEDILKAFTAQAQELMAIIQARDYRDGVLPNANHGEVRIWTEARLRHPVRYHPRRVSLEECSDGYHLHVRNHKLLLTDDEFRALAGVFRALDIDGPYAASYDEVVALLLANDIDFGFAQGNAPGKALALRVPPYHLAKVQAILKAIGFAPDGAAAGLLLRGPRLAVSLVEDRQKAAADYAQQRARRATVRLADYLASQGPAMDPNELNHMGCQVMDLHFALRKGEARPVDDDLQAWFYSPAEQRVIFPWRAPDGTAPAARAQAVYRRWFDLLDSLQLGFVKPRKQVYPAEQQQALIASMHQHVRDTVASLKAVTRIHLMGSALRGDMGRYEVPFVYRRLVKAGSDIDMLIEIDPACEADLPASWSCYMEKASNNGCAVYHLGELPLPDGLGAWAESWPSIDFTQHLLEAYVFLPSRCDPAERDAFLKSFNACQVYERSAPPDEEGAIAAALAKHYAMPAPRVTRMLEPTGNRVYAVANGDQALVLKLSLDAGTYSRRRLGEHARYEAALIEALRARGIRTPAVIPARVGLTAAIEGHEAILFERFEGTVCETLDYPIDAAAAALAKMHCVQLGAPLALSEAFPYEDLCAIWLPYFERSRQTAGLPEDLVAACAALAPIAAHYADPAALAALIGTEVRLHCHGDVKPRNVVVHADGEVSLFDFDNALFAPRLSDVVDGSISFALAEQHIEQVDFARCRAFIDAYRRHAALAAAEEARLPEWLRFGCLLQFTRELTTWVMRHDDLRRRRALAIAAFIAEGAQCATPHVQPAMPGRAAAAIAT
ncbi:MAG: hypothetical protein KGI67_02695 [Pseudomonadota bacterium]|nr:hypothetical protein [Pseudomonadota bacterium]